MEKKLINIIKFVIVSILFFNVGNIITSIFNLLKIDITTFNFKDIAYSEVLMSLFLCIIIFLIYKNKVLKDLREFNKNKKANLIKCFKLFIILLGVKIISSIIIYFISSTLGININISENQSIIDLLISSAPIMMFISTVFFAPFLEEIIFRLGLKKIIKDPGLFILISGLIFGFMHIFPTNINTTVALIQSISYISVGTLLAYYYVANKNIFFVIIIHSLNNLLGVLAALLLI